MDQAVCYYVRFGVKIRPLFMRVYFSYLYENPVYLVGLQASKDDTKITEYPCPHNTSKTTDHVEVEIAAFVLYAQNQRCSSAQETIKAVGDHVAFLARFYQLVYRRMVTFMELDASDVRASMRLSQVYVTLSDQVTFPSISFDFKILYFASNPLMNHVNVV